MQIGEVAQARRALLNAGTVADRDQLRSTLMSRLENDVQALQQRKEIVRDDYRRKLERWRTEEIPADTAVCALPSDVHDSRLYRRTGLFALLCEMALAAWIFSWLGVFWWIGTLVALGITMTLHGIFLHVFDNPERPKEAIYRIRTRVSLPAVSGFLVAFALGMLARYVHGTLAVMLLPAFSLALWLGTLSLVILAASLFTIAHIQGWSARHQKQFFDLERDERINSAFLDELRANASSKLIPPVQTQSSEEAMPSPNTQISAARRGVGFVAGAALAFALINCSGCSTSASSASAPERDLAAETESAALHVFVDTSGSCVPSAFEESWKTVRRELPRLIEQLGIGVLDIWQFDVDGWSPRRVTEIPLPARRTPTRQPGLATEWASFSNIRGAIREADDREWHRQAVLAEERYRQSLDSALRALDTRPGLYGALGEAPRTDILGLLQRISQTNERAPQYFVVLTDLADTRYRTLPKLPEPKGQVQVLVLLVPAQPKDAKMTLGQALPGPEQFGIRQRQLHHAAPWISIAPYFARNLAHFFADNQP